MFVFAFTLSGCLNNNSDTGANSDNSADYQNQNQAEDESGDIIGDQIADDSSVNATTTVTTTNKSTELDLDKEIKDIDDSLKSDNLNELDDSNLSNSQLGI